MTFPTIQTADTKSGVQTSNATTWVLTYPTNLAAGDLILAFVGHDGSTGNPTWPGGPGAGWANTAIGDITVGANVTMQVAAKVADGTETGTFNLVLSGSEQGGWRIFRITGWYGSGLVPNTTATQTTQKDGNGMALMPLGGVSASPNPANLDPANWTTEDTLWLAACAIDTSRTISVFPLAGNNTADVSGGAGGATLGVCTTTSAVSALDPGTFTISASDDWAVATVAIRPAAPSVPITIVGTTAQAAQTTADIGAETFIGIST